MSRIFKLKQKEIAARQIVIPMDGLHACAFDAPAAHELVAVIEVRIAFDQAHIAKSYVASNTACLSILTVAQMHITRIGAFLVGEAFLLAHDPGAEPKQMFFT